MDTKLRAGLIGCGDISPAHLKSYKACGIELAAVCDQDRSRAEARVQEFGSDETLIFTDHQELLKLKDIDFVTVATPVAFHAPITLNALRAGKHVACEKPSALSLAENKAIARAAKKARKKVIFFSSRMRWGEAILARDYINAGDLGRIYRVDVKYYRRRGRPGIDVIPNAHWFINSKLAGGGVIMDMGQYFMDLVLSLIGWPKIHTVSATASRHFPHSLAKDIVFDVEEQCTFLARAGQGVTLTFDLAWIANHPGWRSVSILGDKGGIVMDDRTPFAYYANKGSPWRWINTTTEWKDKTSGNDHVYQDFSQAVRGHDPGIGTTPQEALAITELTQMALLSARKNREVNRAELGV